ncbi:MAG TPA: FHA domain-containing protein [Streptosporangiaceae bacterium]
MSEPRDAVRRPGRGPLPPRSRKRWAIAGGVAAGWVVLLIVTGSAVTATVVLVVIAGLGLAAVLGLRGLGVTRDHPWIQRMAARPWRDGQDVLQLALRHLPDVFAVMPNGSRLAPNLVDLYLNPGDLGSLCERMDIGLINTSASEVYEEQVATQGASFARPGPVGVRVIPDPSVPPGRYRLRHGQPGSPGGYGPEPAYPEPELEYDGPDYEVPAPAPAYAGPGRPGPARDDSPPWRGFAVIDGRTQAHPETTSGEGLPTVMERSHTPVPTLRLVTGDSVAETRLSGAVAGRGNVDLRLPEVPTVSREHARFTFSDGQWSIANLGMNGLTLNGAPLAGEQPLGDNDVIRWGTRPDALQSQVEIG